MTLKEMINSAIKSGTWVITLKDNSKYVVKYEDKVFDNYEWYKTYNTIESELTDSILENLLHDSKSLKRI